MSAHQQCLTAVVHMQSHHPIVMQMLRQGRCAQQSQICASSQPGGLGHTTRQAGLTAGNQKMETQLQPANTPLRPSMQATQDKDF